MRIDSNRYKITETVGDIIIGIIIGGVIAFYIGYFIGQEDCKSLLKLACK